MSCIDVNNLAMKYYIERLLDEKTNEAPMEYLRQRGFMRPIVKKLGLGFADGHLSSFLRGKGFTTQRVFESNIRLFRQETEKKEFIQHLNKLSTELKDIRETKERENVLKIYMPWRK